MIVAMTGHRPHDLWGYERAVGYMVLRDELLRRSQQLAVERQASRFLVGTAQGADAVAFDACLRLRRTQAIEVVAVVPYRQYPDRWGREQRERYLRRLTLANQVIFVDELPAYATDRAPVGVHHPDKLPARNQYLVDHSDLVVVVWAGLTRGNTYDLVQRAIAAGRPLVQHHPFQYCRH